ncbi:phosphate ABC transporter permease PstA [Phytohabitans rumicis]|uniref:Phosphate transport system permease protein PstA n=1 Tax=Phytohabitans rumicis TaxID=1076125 RepID=A0A6V8KW32_9ACTN|nr:phosphate ABC transporter permease PstA [Phytohabitans rumicis]GFJ86519.1 phosphate transport system permease protein PstA [Phytohabitans rumicis]
MTSTTTLPRTPPDTGEPEARRGTSNTRRTDVFAVLGAAASAVALASVVFTQLAPFDALLGFLVVSYVAFLGIYTLLVSLDESGPAVRDRLAAALIHSLAFVMLIGLVVVVGYTFFRGRSALAHLNFYYQDMGLAGPLQPLSVGGVKHAIVGTLEQIGIALTITIPLGIIGAVFLSEVPGPFSRFVRIIVEAMTALPSIVAGLFIFAMVILGLGMQKSGLAAGLALSVMMLPIIIRAADVVIRLVPGTLREAALALGASQWRTIWHVVLPTARSGITTAVILGTARGIGETSPVLLTAGFAQTLNADPTSGAQTSLPLYTFQMVRTGEPGLIARAFGAAAVLMVLVLFLFALARLVGGRAPGQLGRGQRRRRARASRRDAVRFAARERARGPVPADTDKVRS